MTWIWNKKNPRDLARYATPEAGLLLKTLSVSTSHERRMSSANWASKITEAIYNSLASESITYDNAPFWPGKENSQEIRQPHDIFGKSGTCLDLALLFSGVCLYKGLIPILLIFDDGRGGGHALVAVSVDKELHEFNDNRQLLYHELARNDPAAPLFRDQNALINAIELKQRYFAIECTGFVYNQQLSTLNGPRNHNGRLGFSEAVSMGRDMVLNGKLLYAVDLAIEQRGLPTFSCAPINHTILGHAQWVKSRWAKWAKEEPPWSPPFGVVQTDDRVASPLNTAWQDFLKADAWHSITRSQTEKLTSYILNKTQPHKLLVPELSDLTDIFHDIPWQGSYLSIQSKAKTGVQRVLTELRTQILKLEKDSDPSDPLLEDLKDCRNKAVNFQSAIQSPNFNRCFLVTASDGSGKTFFIDSVLRRAQQLERDSAILIRLRLLDNRDSLEDAILHEIARIFQIRVPKFLNDIDKYLNRAGLRLVVAIEDLQSSLSHHYISLDHLLETIRDCTSLHSIYWLLTLNDTSYDRVAAKYELWTSYGYTSPNVKNLQHSGWIRLDEMNRTVGLGLELLSVNRLEESDLGNNFSLKSEFDQSHFSSPLIALIVLELSTGTAIRSLVGLNIIQLVKKFWRQRLINVDPAPFNVDQAKDAVFALAKLLGKIGSLSIPKPMAKSSLEKHDAADLECLQRLSLLRLDSSQSQPVYKSRQVVERVQLLFELFWGLHLAIEFEDHFASLKTTSKKNRLTVVEERLNTIEFSDIREAVAQYVLLLTDARAKDEPKHEKHAANLWLHFQTSKRLPTAAVYFAASKATAERQSQILRELAKKDQQPLANAREVFAVMHLLLESDQVSILEALSILRFRTERRGSFFQLIADAGLEDYFWYLLERRMEDQCTLSNWVKCVCLLANCHILKVAGKAAEAVWLKLKTCANGKSDVIINVVQEYLETDSKGAQEEKNCANPNEGKGGEPHFFREHFLRHVFDMLLNEKSLEIFNELRQRKWFQRKSTNETKNHRTKGRKQTSIDLITVYQVRKHWAQECGNWYRMRADFDDRKTFQNLIVQLIPSDDPDDWELAYFMVRHTGPIDNDNTALADPCFAELFSQYASKLSSLWNRFRISFG